MTRRVKNIGLHFNINAIDEISSLQILKAPTTHDKSERNNSLSLKNHSSPFSKDQHSGNPKIIQPLLAATCATKN